MTKRRDTETIDLFIERACLAEDVPLCVLLSPRRDRPIVEVRFAIMLAAQRAGYGAVAIAKRLGRKDHTTVLNGVKRADELVRVDPGFCALVSHLEAAA